MAAKGAQKRKMLTPEQRQDVIDSKGKMKAEELAKKHGITVKAIYNIWSKAAKKGVVKKASAVKTGKGKRLTAEQRQEIIAKKEIVSGAILAKEYAVTVNTIYNIWNKAKKNAKKKAGRPRGAVAVARKSANPNQNRIDFCKRWIAILQSEVNRLESEPDLLKEVEAALAKIVGQS
jgi:transposase